MKKELTKGELIFQIVLFWAIVLFGGTIAGVFLAAMGGLGAGDILRDPDTAKCLGIPFAGIIAEYIMREKCEDKVLLLNCLAALGAEAGVLVHILVTGTWKATTLIGYGLSVVFFGMKVYKALKKEKSPGADNTEG